MPSAMAVLPTPASPTRIGLFLVRRERICNTRRISSSRPITGSSLPERACSLRLTAYLPSASNCCSEVCESTVAPLRKIRIASRSSFSVAPLRLRMSAACPRSATSPSRRCSTEAYLSPKFLVKSTARWITFEVSCAKNCSPPPSTRGREPTARWVSSRSPRTFTPTRPSRNVASESSSRISTASRWSGSTACCPRSRARLSAACNASCALMVKVFIFIIAKLNFTRSDGSRPGPQPAAYRRACKSDSPSNPRPAGTRRIATGSQTQTIRHQHPQNTCQPHFSVIVSCFVTTRCQNAPIWRNGGRARRDGGGDNF